MLAGAYDIQHAAGIPLPANKTTSTAFMVEIVFDHCAIPQRCHQFRRRDILFQHSLVSVLSKADSFP
jgi:hypothetical protein